MDAVIFIITIQLGYVLKLKQKIFIKSLKVHLRFETIALYLDRTDYRECYVTLNFKDFVVYIMINISFLKYRQNVFQGTNMNSQFRYKLKMF